MNNRNLEKAKVVLLGVIATFLLCLLVVVSLKFKEDKNYKNDVQNNDNNSGVTDVIPEKEDTSVNDDEITEVEDNNTSKNPDNSVSNSESSNGSQGVPNNKESVTYHESDVVAYFEELNQDIDTYRSSDNTSVKEKIKTGFITVVDFLFYDGVIKGHTFDELTSEAKIKILTLALKIDNKIEEYFPNYKESVKDKASAFKEKVAILYLEATSKLCESVGEESCNLARENFKDMKESFGFTWEGIKKVATTSASKLSVLLKEWYQSIKN